VTARLAVTGEPGTLAEWFPAEGEGRLFRSGSCEVESRAAGLYTGTRPGKMARSAPHGSRGYSGCTLLEPSCSSGKRQDEPTPLLLVCS